MVNFSSPATGGGRVDWRELNGTLLVLVPIEVRRDVPTTIGDSATKDVVVADVHFLDGDRKGDWEPGVWIFPKVLFSQLESKVHPAGAELVLGRLGQEPATKAGRSPAWKLGEPTPDDVTAAQRWHAWRLDQGLPITSVGKPVPVATPDPVTATSFTPRQAGEALAAAMPATSSLADQVAASKANVAAASGTWPGAGAEPPF